MKLLIPPILREYNGGQESVEVNGATVDDAIAGLDEALRTRLLDGDGRLFAYLRVFVNDEQATGDTTVKPGDVIEIAAAAVGG